MVTEGHSSAALLAEPSEGLPAFDDHALMLRFARRGDRGAMDELVRRHWDVAYRVALRQTGSSADAEDCVQEAWSGLCRRANQYDGRGTVRAWLLQSVVNACRMRYRSEVARSAREDSAGTAEYDRRRPSAPDIEMEELRELVRDAIRELPDTYRLPVWLRYVEDLSLAEVAQALDRNEATVRSQIHRGLKRLTERLQRYGAMLAVPVLAGRLGELAAATSNPPPPPGLRLPAPDGAVAASPSVALAGAGWALPLLAVLSVVGGLAVSDQRVEASAGSPPAGMASSDAEPSATAARPTGMAGGRLAWTAPGTGDRPGMVFESAAATVDSGDWSPLLEFGTGASDRWSFYVTELDSGGERASGLVRRQLEPVIETQRHPAGRGPVAVLDATPEARSGVGLVVGPVPGERRRVRAWIRVTEPPPAADPSAGLTFTALVRRGGEPAPREVADDPAVLAAADLNAGRWVRYECMIQDTTREGAPATELQVFLDGTRYRRAVLELRSDQLVILNASGARVEIADLRIEVAPPSSL